MHGGQDPGLTVANLFGRSVSLLPRMELGPLTHENTFAVNGKREGSRC